MGNSPCVVRKGIGMKVLKPRKDRSVWTQENKCHNCEAVLLVEEKDLFVRQHVNEAKTLIVWFECCECRQWLQPSYFDRKEYPPGGLIRRLEDECIEALIPDDRALQLQRREERRVSRGPKGTGIMCPNCGGSNYASYPDGCLDCSKDWDGKH